MKNNCEKNGDMWGPEVRSSTINSAKMDELDENLDVVKLIFKTRFFQQKLVRSEEEVI